MLHRAARKGDLISILILGLVYVNYKAENSMGLLPIMSAFEGKDTQVIELLWKNIADDSLILRHSTTYGHRFVHFCAAYEDSKILRKVLNMSIRDMLPQTMHGDLTPMHISFFNGILENVIQLYTFYPQQVYLWDSLGEIPIHKVRNLNILKYFNRVDSSLLPLKNVLNGKQAIHYVSERQLVPLIVFILDEYPGCWVTRDYNDKKWTDYALDSTKAEVLKLVKTIPHNEQ